jgi:hypothetical protein
MIGHAGEKNKAVKKAASAADKGSFSDEGWGSNSMSTVLESEPAQ